MMTVGTEHTVVRSGVGVGSIGAGALILLYHRVAETPTDPQLLCVTPSHFAEHLQMLREGYRPMSLERCLQLLGEGSLPANAVVITFDDGYADNLLHAAPLLGDYDIPATVFVTARVDTDTSEFWWDELDRLLLAPSELPVTLRLTVGQRVYRWQLNGDTGYSADDYERHRRWNVLQQDAPTLRHAMYRELCNLLRPLRHLDRARVLDELRDWAGAQRLIRTTHRTLCDEELVQLANEYPIEIGGHTVSHPVLAALTPSEQRDEVRQCKTHLEEILGRTVRSFSYPYGSRSDYTEQTVRIVREEGFTCACSNIPGTVTAGTDLFELPRMLVRDWNAETLELRLLEVCPRD